MAYNLFLNIILPHTISIVQQVHENGVDIKWTNKNFNNVIRVHETFQSCLK